MKTHSNDSDSDTMELDAVDHVALSVDDIGEAVEWYRNMFTCRVKYQDSTWALLEFRNTKIALVVASQHPPHIGFISPRAADFGQLATHRDGTRSIYVQDSSGNSIELMADDRNSHKTGRSV